MDKKVSGLTRATTITRVGNPPFSEFKFVERRVGEGAIWIFCKTGIYILTIVVYPDSETPYWMGVSIESDTGIRYFNFIGEAREFIVDFKDYEDVFDMMRDNGCKVPDAEYINVAKAGVSVVQNKVTQDRETAGKFARELSRTQAKVSYEGDVIVVQCGELAIEIHNYAIYIRSGGNKVRFERKLFAGDFSELCKMVKSGTGITI